MRRVNLGVEAPLLHGDRLLDHIEGEPMRWFPTRDGFDEGTSRELAVTHRADPLSFDARAQWIGDPRLEEPALGLRQLSKGDDVLPDLLR